VEIGHKTFACENIKNEKGALEKLGISEEMDVKGAETMSQ